MRVLDTRTGQFVEIDPKAEDIKYAILSHTWDSKGEQTYQQLRKIQRRYAPSDGDSSSDEDHSSRTQSDARIHSPPTSSSEPPLSLIWSDRKLSPKIREACRIARENGYDYLWIDSCCIDKTSSSELSESINSMYQWYARAHVCYAYLPDVPAEDLRRGGFRSSFRCSRWFTRGWTLQELIAPFDVRFLSKDWTFIGSKESLADLVVEITRINHDALLNLKPLDHFSIAQRFSWAAERKTTREEDRAYSLLGIFDISMPTLYGEGSRTFRRLQEEIMRRTPDQSLFAWTFCGLPDPSSSLYKLLTTILDGQNTKDYPGLRLLLFTQDFPFLAQSLNHSMFGADITALSHAEVAHRLQLRPDQLSTTEYTFTPYGIRTQLPVISLSDFFPPGRIMNITDISQLSQWYLLILGCEHKRFPGNLLARVCYMKPSGLSPIQSLQPGAIRIDFKHFDLLPVSPATITHLYSSGKRVSIKIFYIPEPERDMMGDITRQRRHETIKLVLLENAYEALSAQGYTATLSSPDHDAHPCTQSVTLSHDTHAITIDYQHILGDHENGWQQLAIEAQVKISGTNLQDTPGNLGVPLKADVSGSVVSWQGSARWGWEKELDFKDVELNIPESPMALTLRLGLTLAKTNHYLLRIELKMPNPPQPTRALQPRELGASQMAGDSDTSTSRRKAIGERLYWMLLRLATGRWV